MGKPLPTIITDLDGTLVNIMDEVVAGLWQTFGAPIQPAECVKYSVHESFWQFLREDLSSVDALNQFLIRNFWTNTAVLDRCRPYWDMWCAYMEFHEAGGTIIVLTGRPPTAAVQATTQIWLERWGLNGVRSLFSRRPGRGPLTESQAKLEDCKRILAESGEGTPVWFVDDQPATCELVTAAGLENLTVYMVERPWTYHSFGLRGIKKRYIIQDIEEELRRIE